MASSASFVPARVLTASQLADLYFIEHRAKLLDLAALLDRLERAGGAGGAGETEHVPGTGAGDPRAQMLRRAIPLLVDGKPERARRILELFSDPTPEPIEHAGTKGATGVWAPAAAGAGAGTGAAR